MAPGSRARASRAAANSPPASTFADLPDAVLVHVLGLLPGLKERQRAALVCRRFAAAARSPQLLREVALPRWVGLQDLQSQAAWLARHGRHVRKLSLNGAADDEDDAGCVASAVSSCLSMVGSGGQLTELTVTVTPVCHSDWLLAMRPLQRLKLAASTLLHISPAISQLTALQSLELSAEAHEYAAGVQLPSSITRLEVAHDEAEEMSEQAAQLPRLQRLRLEGCSYSADSMSQLSALSGSLTRLDLSGNSVPPATSLAALKQLQHLYCVVHDEAATQAVAAALPHLTGLTCLVLFDYRGWDALLPALSGLSRLQLCLFWKDHNEASTEPLPGGPWLHSLRWLCADAGTLLRSTAVLQAAAALESVSLCCNEDTAVDWYSPAATGLFDWLATHPPLRHLIFEGDLTANIMAGTWPHLLQLWRRRPALLVQAPGFGDNEDESCYASVCDNHPF